MDISPSDLVDLTLPVYKAMLPMAGPAGMTADMIIKMTTTANHYVSVSFIRLLTSAARRLRLTSTHYRAVLHSLMNDSGMMLASNISQEQVSHPDSHCQCRLNVCPVCTHHKYHGDVHRVLSAYFSL